MVGLKNEFYLASKLKLVFPLLLVVTFSSFGNHGIIASSSTNTSCASIATSHGHKIELFENRILDSVDYEAMRYGKLTNSFFEVKKFPGEWCLLEVCGFTWPPLGKSEDAGKCDRFITGITRTSGYNENFELTSLGCACSNDTCKNGTCSSENITWRSNQCAVLYQDKNCQSCVFRPITLLYGVEFSSLNSFQIKSAIVRPGCTIAIITKGYLFRDLTEPYTVSFSGVVNNFTQAYHKDSENFTCTCDNFVLADMAANETPVVIKRDLPEGGSEDNHDNRFDIQFLIPIIGATLLTIVGIYSGFKLFRVWKRREDSNDGKTNTSTRSIVTNETVEMSDLSVPQIIVADQQIPVDILMDQLKAYVERLFEFSKQEEELHGPSVNMTAGMVVTDDLSIATNQFHRVCEPQFIINRDEFSIGEECGRGQFGIVYKGVLERKEEDKTKDGAFVAIKRLKSSGVQEKVLISFLREVKNFQFVAISHENIVRFYGACYHNGEFYILTELCDNGSLDNYLKDVMHDKIFGKKESAEEMEETCGYLIVNKDTTETHSSSVLQTTELQQLLHWAEQIAYGMEYLHRMKIIHLDLAIRNVLLTSKLTAKIADLGLSRKCTDGKDYARSLLEGVFPRNSFAHECTTGNLEDAMRMTSFIDVWAYGCTVWEIFSFGEKPYINMNIVGVAEFIRSGARLPQPELAPTYVYEKLLECWNKVPQQRPTFHDLCKFFAEKRLEEKDPPDLNYLKISTQ